MVEQTPLERERQRRIQVCVWAYAYEYLSASIVDDATFDRVCREIDVSICTNNPIMDSWFKQNFDPCTGSWIGKHPFKTIVRERAIQLLNYNKINYFDDYTRETVTFKDEEPTVKGEIVRNET